ncbi:hypothetical protein [Xanthovirga aplysinae]|uniref:hypothetical protein n=1 Tax=Xanthovirga aplysinae TaxID=2529853 RepID=UPI0012BB9DAE|nr:hypothetical protein [Xanthovirga aplysinae]MTI31827.1 hypothetical protein [Xanthovirga aplysinae]
MNWNFSEFLNTEAFFSFSVIICLFLFVFLIKLALKKRKGLIPRIVAIVVLIASLFCLAIRPSIFKEKEERKAIILTPNFSKIWVDSLLAEFPEAYTFSMDTTDSLSSLPKINAPDLSYILRNYTNIDEFFICGIGLSDEDLRLIKDRKFTYFSADPPRGIITFELPKPIHLGEKFFLKGVYHDLNSNGKTLYLKGPEGILDSLVFNRDKFQEFSFQHRPKVVGNYLYQFLIKDKEGNFLDKEEFPVRIKKKEPTNIVFLNSQPGFEIRFLTNWLSDQGHHLLTRTAISKEKYRFGFFNGENLRQFAINKSLLKNTDLLITDLQALMDLKSNERQYLKSAVENEGMGVLLLATQADFSTQKINRSPLFRSFNYNEVQNREKEIQFGKESFSLEVLPFSLKRDFNQFPIFKNKELEGVVGWKLSGRGKSGLNLAQNTFQWVLEGRQQVYDYYWSEVLKPLLKKKGPDVKWYNPEKLAIQHEPMELRVFINGSDSLPPANIKGPSGQLINLPLMEDYQFSEEWKTTFWPLEAGWHQLNIHQRDPSGHLFVFSDSSWQSLREAELIRNNHYWSSVQRNDNQEIAKQLEKEEIPLFWFAFLFLLALSYLWFEEKFL